MTHPYRGQVYNAFLGRHARGNEIGAKPGPRGAYRHVVIISNSDINKGRDRVTIAPVMNYKAEGKELHINWGFWLPNSDVEDARLNEDNFVDCGQLWTVFSPHTSEKSKKNLPQGINLNNYRGTLKYRERLDLALQIVVNDKIVIGQDIRASKFNHIPMQGDVVELDLPNYSKRAQALVISAPGIDTIRNIIPLKATNQPLGHITVIPIENQTVADDISSRVAIEIQTENKIIHHCQAVCYEIYTIDWKERRHKIIGTVRNMDKVIHKLRQYLDLPVLAPADTIGLEEPGASVPAERQLAGEELAAEIRRINDLSNSLGLVYHTIQEEAQQSYLAGWEPDIFSAKEPIKAISIETGVVDSIKNLIEICFASFQPAELTVLSKAGVADLSEPFPSEQQLPLEWFDGHAVFLRFHRGAAGNWSVSRIGLSEELFLQLWSRDEQPLGPPLTVGDRPIPLPIEGIEALSTIKIRLASAQESEDE